MDEIVVVGDLLVDVIVRPHGPVVAGSDSAASVRLSGGGSAANTACWLASIGRTVRLVAAVGDDMLGRHALAEIESSGVEFAGEVDPTRPTGTCVVLVDSNGERTMLPDRGANDGLSPAAVDSTLHDGPGRVHLSGYTLLHDGSRAAGLAALTGTRVSVDASSAAPLEAVGADRFLGWVDGCDLLFANEDEIEVLGGVANVLRSAGAVVVKRGAAGATWTDGRAIETVPALAVDVVDTIGAGDAFAAGFLDGGLTRACELAARAVSQPGGRPPNLGSISG